MKLTEKEAREAFREIWDRNLYGRSFMSRLTFAQMVAAANGIGPDSWKEEYRAKLDKWLATFRLAAIIHDCRFTWNNDGSRERFDAANDEIEKNCRLLADQKYCCINPWRYFARRAAHLVGEACRMFGWDAWQKAFDKKNRDLSAAEAQRRADLHTNKE